MLAIYIMIGGAVVIGVMGIALKVQSARLESEKAEHAATTAKFEAFVSDTKRIGLEAQKKADAEKIRQKGVSDATIKTLESRIAATRAQFAKLRDGRTDPGQRDLPAVPVAAKPVDDTARDNQLRAVLQHAQEQTDRLIEIQGWVTEQAAR
jgi:hypothetical protein